MMFEQLIRDYQRTIDRLDVVIQLGIILILLMIIMIIGVMWL